MLCPSEEADGKVPEFFFCALKKGNVGHVSDTVSSSFIFLKFYLYSHSKRSPENGNKCVLRPTNDFTCWKLRSTAF